MVIVIKWAMGRHGAVLFIDATMFIVITVRLFVQCCWSNGIGRDTIGSWPQLVSHFLLWSCRYYLIEVVGDCHVRGALGNHLQDQSLFLRSFQKTVRSFATLLEVEEAWKANKLVINGIV